MLKALIKRFIPQKLISSTFLIRHPRLLKERHRKSLIIKATKKSREDKLRELRDKGKIRCIFLCLFDSVWKCDSLYKLMIENDRFEPVLLICPVVNNGYENMISRMESCYKYLEEKGYSAIKSFNPDTGQYIDIRNDLKADILIYTNPYEGLIDDRYYITHYPDLLSIYIPYAFQNNRDYYFCFNNFLQNLVWRYYIETENIKTTACTAMINKGKNLVVSGYPGIELLLDKNYTPKSPWANDNRKRIIWAPHHTIHAAGPIHYSCFIEYSEFMIELAKKYHDKITIAFKPHPILKSKLYEIWGKEKTDKYYSEWENMDNTFIQEGDYIDLFLTSDAMIHDCGSFLIEYLYTNKPVMRMMNDIPPESLYNDLALKALDVYYKGFNKEDVESFIIDIINGSDTLKQSRSDFISQYLLPPNGRTPSENILSDIIFSIDNGIN